MTAAGLVAAVSVLGLLGLAGCDSHSKPTVPTEAPQSPDPAVSASSTASVSPSPDRSSASSPSQMLPTTGVTGSAALTSAYPRAAAAEPAAIAVVKQYFVGMNHELATGDEAVVSKTFDSRCSRCISGVVTTKGLFDGGNSIHGGEMHLNSVVSVYPVSASSVTVIVNSSEDASRQVDASGRLVRSYAAVPSTKLVFVVAVGTTAPVIVDLSVLTS